MEGRGKKILFGCLGGCGVVVVIFIGSCVGFTMWLNSPGEVLEPEVLLGPETTGYVEWTLRLEDPGTAEFTDALLRSFDSLSSKSNSPLPDGLESFINSRRTKSVRKDMQRLFPVVVAWTAQPGDVDNEDDHLLSVSARGMGHQLILMDWMLGFALGWAEGDLRIERHRGEKIYLFEKSGAIQPAAFVQKGIVFVATDLDSARGTLDRLESPFEGSGAGTELATLFDALPEDQALRGVLTNRRGEVRRVLDQLGLSTDRASDTTWNEVRGVTVTANFRDEDVFAGTMEVHGPSADWAEANAETLGAALASLFDKWDVEFDTEVGSVGRRVHVDFSAADLLEHVENIN